ncbi:DUF302 domain-containing protein [uncultured Algimonas sp.]|uniref:DUF302 domain-containing protein n=1 Tax=uncultured Algimonas sp. TaxID=1547920 RepID=UPI00262B1A0D|nr:DUF302 domain-containing protein [uncultured Algimonas sp.]
MKSFAPIAACLLLSACSSLPDSIPLPDAMPLSERLPLPVRTSVGVSDSFVAAETRLRDAISARNFRLFAVIDHGAGALSVGRDIGQSKLFVFGNPQGGAPLMQAEPELGFSLPLKMLIYTDESGRTRIIHTDIAALRDHYRIEGQDDHIDRMRATLRAMAMEAAG